LPRASSPACRRSCPDEEDEADAIGSLSQSAEALRITAAVPVRSTSIGGDYDG
jgi:DNA-directed RNA polymerase subunit omega